MNNKLKELIRKYRETDMLISEFVQKVYEEGLKEGNKWSYADADNYQAVYVYDNNNKIQEVIHYEFNKTREQALLIAKLYCDVMNNKVYNYLPYDFMEEENE